MIAFLQPEMSRVPIGAVCSHIVPRRISTYDSSARWTDRYTSDTHGETVQKARGAPIQKMPGIHAQIVPVPRCSQPANVRSMLRNAGQHE